MAAPLPETDGDLVRLALDGRQDAFSALYERYFPSVFDFVTRLLRNREEAADVAQDTFIKAMEQLPTLRNPDRFKSWIFTIAHRTGLNRIRSSKRTATVGGSVDDDERSTMAVADADPNVDPEQVTAIQHAADLVWEAAAGLDARTYAVMDLHVRQGLDSAEIAEVMGVSKGNAYTMVSRMKQSFSKTLSTYMLVRKGRQDCPKLAAVVGPDMEQLTPEIRKRADRHVNNCDVCSTNRVFYLEPLKMFAALMLVPVPAGLKAAIWGSVATSAAGAAGAGTVAAAGSASGSSSSGTAAGVAVASQTASVAAMAGAALVAVGVIAGAFFAFGGDDEPLTPVAVPDTTTTIVAAPAPTPSPPATTEATTTTSTSSTTTSTSTTTTTTTTTTTVIAAPTPTTQPPAPALPAFTVTDDSGSVAEDASITLDVLANDVGPVDAATLAITSGPSNGSAATTAAGAILYTPAADFSGADQLSYSVADTLGRSGSGTVAVTVVPINDLPVVPGPGAIDTAEDSTISFDPLAGAADVDGDVLVMTAFDATSAAGGSLAEGSLIYTPPADFFGTDTFSYTVSDGTISVEVTVTMTVTAVPDPPRAPVGGPPALDVQQGSVATVDLLVGWSDPDGDALTVVPGTVTTSSGGTVTIDADGTATYTPGAGFTGADSFDFVVTDGALETSATVAVNVQVADNQAPVADDVVLVVAEDVAVGTVVGVVTASDPDGDAVTFTPVSGVVSIDDAGTVTVGGSLDFETQTTHTATTTVSDGNGGETRVTVTFQVTDVNDEPVADDVVFVVAEDVAVGTVVGVVTASDPDGDAVTFTPVSGVVSIDDAGTVTVGGSLDFETETTHTATTTVSDGNGGETQVTVTIEVANVNEAPSISDGVVAVQVGQRPGRVVATLVGADPDGDDLTYAIVSGDPEGVFSLDADTGELSYVKRAEDLPFPTQLVVSVTDPGGLTDDAVFTIVLVGDD